MEPVRVIMKCCSSQWRRTLTQQCWSRSRRVPWGQMHSIGRFLLPYIICGRSVLSSSIPLMNHCPNYTCYTRTFCVLSQNRLCWSCQAELSKSDLFCPSCTTLQPPDENRDFFQILDCERTFNIDTQELQRKYRNLQRLLHPDYFSQKSESEQSISEKQSTLVNKAYNTLLSPLSRGIYLLSLHDITLIEGADPEMDMQFLFDILEISEQLNDADSKADIEEIGSTVQVQLESLTEAVRNAFQKDDVYEAKILLSKMKYFANIQDQVKKKIIP